MDGGFLRKLDQEDKFRESLMNSLEHVACKVPVRHSIVDDK